MTKRQLDRLLHNAYAKYFDRVQVNIMNLSKIFQEAEDQLALGTNDLETIFLNLVAKYREN